MYQQMSGVQPFPTTANTATTATAPPTVVVRTTRGPSTRARTATGTRTDTSARPDPEGARANARPDPEGASANDIADSNPPTNPPPNPTNATNEPNGTTNGFHVHTVPNPSKVSKVIIGHGRRRFFLVAAVLLMVIATAEGPTAAKIPLIEFHELDLGVFSGLQPIVKKKSPERKVSPLMEEFMKEELADV